MRVLVLCKRFSTGKDSLADRYGRLFHLPEGLARHGWDVDVLSLSYRRWSGGVEAASAPRFAWRDFPVGPKGLLAYREAISGLEASPPDVVWSTSDALHAVIGARVASAFRVPHVVDLYDDYEAFGLTRIPGLRRGLRAACLSAAGVTVVSRTLMETLAQRMPGPIAQHHLPNGVMPLTVSGDKTALLSRLGLPHGARLVGTVGALDPERGIGDLFGSFEILARRFPDLHLVLVGREQGPSVSLRHPRIHRLGVLPHAEALAVIAALDVSVVCNRDGLFARACHPMKLVESAMVGTPVVAAAVGEVARLLQGRPDSLYRPGDLTGLAERIEAQLGSPKPLDPTLARQWDDLAEDLGRILVGVVRGARDGSSRD